MKKNKHKTQNVLLNSMIHLKENIHNAILHTQQEERRNYYLLQQHDGTGEYYAK